MTRARDLAAFVSNADGDIKFDTDTLFIDSSANRVGIGNTAPSRPLHITANPAMILLEDSAGGSNDKKAQIQVDSGAFEVNARNDDDSSRTDNILVADLGNGKVGIGTNSPDGTVHIRSTLAELYLQSDDGQLAQKFNVFDWKNISLLSVPLVGIHFFFQLMYDYGTDQITVQRMMSTGSLKNTKKAIIFNAIADFIIISLLVFIGLGLFSFYKVNNLSMEICSFPTILLLNFQTDYLD